MAKESATFFDRLAEAMIDQGVSATQAGIAQALKVGRSSVEKWAKGGVPTLDTIAEIAQRTGTTVEWLLTGQGQPRADGDADLAELLRLYGRLRMEGRSFVIQAARYAVKAQATAGTRRRR